MVLKHSNELPQNAKVSYLTADHLGSPRIVTDGIRAVVSRHDYLAFGDEVTETVGNVAGRTSAQGYGETDEIRKQYTGYERDKESGLDFAQARYYNSQQGRFTSVDPLTASASIRNPQTFNRYSYVLNSPYKFTDPLGLLAETVACGSLCPQSIGNGFNGGTVFDSLDGLGHKQQFAERSPPPPPAQNGEIPENLKTVIENFLSQFKNGTEIQLDDESSATITRESPAIQNLVQFIIGMYIVTLETEVKSIINRKPDIIGKGPESDMGDALTPSPDKPTPSNQISGEKILELADEISSKLSVDDRTVSARTDSGEIVQKTFSPEDISLFLNLALRDAQLYGELDAIVEVQRRRDDPDPYRVINPPKGKPGNRIGR